MSFRYWIDPVPGQVDTYAILCGEHDADIGGIGIIRVRANAERVVACLNACEGLNTQTLVEGTLNKLVVAAQTLWDGPDARTDEAYECANALVSK